LYFARFLSVHIGGPSSNQESRKRPSNPSDSKESRSLRTDTKKIRPKGSDAPLIPLEAAIIAAHLVRDEGVAGSNPATPTSA
jgi:hypothetical protein